MKSNSSTVLYAEDLEEDIYFMERAFQMSHVSLQLQTVRDGQLAIQYLEGKGAYADRDKYPMPFLVLLDLKMPHIGGFEVLEWMRSQDCFRDIAIYILSSSLLREDQKIAARLGANGFWIKKTNFSELLQLVRQLDSFALPANNSQASVTVSA